MINEVNSNYLFQFFRWSKVAPSYFGTSCQVRGLDEGTQYEFRVMAENALGQSEPLTTTEPVTAKWPFSKNHYFIS